MIVNPDKFQTILSDKIKSDCCKKSKNWNHPKTLTDSLHYWPTPLPPYPLPYQVIMKSVRRKVVFKVRKKVCVNVKGIRYEFLAGLKGTSTDI